MGAVLATGLLNSLAGIGSLADLGTTRWGRSVLVKVALLAGIAGLGWLDRRRSLPGLAQGGVSARRQFRRVALVEVGVMLLAFGAATGLASSIPADDEVAMRQQLIATAATADAVPG